MANASINKKRKNISSFEKGIVPSVCCKGVLMGAVEKCHPVSSDTFIVDI